MNENKFINSEYLNKNPQWHIEDSTWKAKQVLKIITRNDIMPKTLCDVGCGAGEVINQMYLQLPKDTLFYGYEVSPQAFELCKKKERERLIYRQADIIKDDASFYDVILALDVIEHLEDYFDFLRNLRSKGNYKIFHIPLDISLATVFLSSPILWRRKKVGHIHYFTKETAFASLKDTSYEILDYFYTAWSSDFPSPNFISLLAQLPRKLMFKINKDLAVRTLGGYSLMVLTR